MKLKEMLAYIITAMFVAFVIWTVVDKPDVNSDKLKKVVVTYQSDEYTTDALISIATEKGYFAKEGIKVERNTAAQKVSAVLESGEVDFSIDFSPVSLQNYLNGIDVVFVYKVYERPTLVGAVYTETSPEIGKKVAVSRKGGLINLYNEIAKPNLNNNENQEYVIVPSGAPQIAAIERKDVDYTIANIYTGKIVSSKGSELKFIEPGDLWKNKKIPVGVVVTKKKLQDDPQDIRDFIKGIDRAIKYSKDNPQEFKNYLVSGLSLDPVNAQKITDAFMASVSSTHTTSIEEWGDVIRAVRTMELQAPDRDPASHIDNSLLN